MFMKKLTKFVFCLFFVPMNMFANIEQLNTFVEIRKYLHHVDEDTLIIFDIDDTLTMTEDPAFQRPYFKKYSQSIEKVFKNLTKDQQYLFANLCLINTSSRLIENQSSAILGELQKRKIKMIALTAAMTGDVNKVNLEQKRYEDLKKVGIDFSSSFSEFEIIHFKELKPFFGRFPIFFKGILLANGDFRKNKNINTKGDVFIAFLDKISWIPKKVIFVDDKIEHLQFLQESLHNLNPEIAFIGLHYIGAQKITSLEITQEAFEKRWEEIAEMTRQYTSQNKE